MPKKGVQDGEVKKAMERLFECIGPFEMALRQGDLAVTVNQQPIDAGLADVVATRMRELEECLCRIFWSVLLLTGYEYQSGKSANLILMCVVQKMLMIHKGLPERI
jgi:hypothetical protein